MEIIIPENSLVLISSAEECSAMEFCRKNFLGHHLVNSFDKRKSGILKEAESLLKDNKPAIVITPLDYYLRDEFIDLARHWYVQPVSFILKGNYLCEVSETYENKLYKAYRNFETNHRVYKYPHPVYIIRSHREYMNISVRFVPLKVNKKYERESFDIIADIHGCFDELEQLLLNLGYVIDRVKEDGKNYGYKLIPPRGRKLIFAGDLADRGPEIPEVFRLAMSMVNDGTGYCIPGNHDDKLLRKLKGRRVQVKHGLERSVEQLSKEPRELSADIRNFLEDLPSHLVLDDGKLVVAHAGLKEEMQGRENNRIKDFCLYGETTGESDEHGLPVRLNWSETYKGKAFVVYGHTPVDEPYYFNNTVNIDTGCVFGGRLTAFRYPEIETVSVPARKQYAVPARPLRTAKNFVP